MQVHADPFLQQRAARSRSRFDFAQDDSQPSSNGHQGNGQTDSNLSFAAWANTSGGMHTQLNNCLETDIGFWCSVFIM